MENSTSTTSDREEQVRFHVSCQYLKDPNAAHQVRLSSKETFNSFTWTLLSETEIVPNNLNPHFQSSFLVDFIFEANQFLKFEVVQHHFNGSSEILGSYEATVGMIMGAWDQTIMSDIQGQGQIIVKGEKVKTGNQLIFWQWVGVKLKSMRGCFGKNEPMLKFFKKEADGDYVQVHKTEAVQGNPIWKPFKILDSVLCSKNHSQSFKVECWDQKGNKEVQLIGQLETNLEKIIQSGAKNYMMYNPKKKSTTGVLEIHDFSIGPKRTFLDHIIGGTQLDLTVAIDFTSSNENPSLHYQSMDPPNQYYRALELLCPKILNYDSGQLVSLYGFGAGLPEGQASDCYPLVGDEEVQVKGTQGVLDAYLEHLNNVKFGGGARDFLPVIQKMSEKGQRIKETGDNKYMILLLLTSGDMPNMDRTIHQIRNVSELPLSIIIVQVGKAGMGNFIYLTLVVKNSRRDMFQYVPFGLYQNDQDSLAKYALKDIPNQVADHNERKGRKAMGF